MIKLKLSKKWLAVAAAITIVVAFGGIFLFNLNRGLAVEPLSNTIELTDMEWASEQQTFFNFRADASPPKTIEGLPTDDHVYFTNTHLTDEYQFAQTAGENWTESQRLFWRKSSTREWQEITLTVKDVSPSGFVSKNGRKYLAATGGEIAEDQFLYLIDIEEGTLQKQFKATDLVISPDSAKIFCNNNPTESWGFHELMVYDLNDGSITYITSLSEVSPGSGRSFDYKWSKDSKSVEIKGWARKGGEAQRFRYIYDHENKKLFSV